MLSITMRPHLECASHLELAKLLDLGGTSPWKDTENVETDLRVMLVLLLRCWIRMVFDIQSC